MFVVVVVVVESPQVCRGMSAVAESTAMGGTWENSIETRQDSWEAKLGRRWDPGVLLHLGAADVALGSFPRSRSQT